MAVEVLRLLGEYTNNHFGPLGGFSARHSRSQILTVLPRISLIEAQEMVDSFAQTLNDAGLSRIESLAQSRIGGDACSEILVQAGITGVVANDDIDHIIQKAVANQRVVATFRCESGGNQP